MVRLNAGKDAQASVLTKMIRPQQPLPDESKGHQTIVILVDKFLNEKGKPWYHFKYPHSDDNDPLLSASAHFVKVEREGHPSLFFNEPVEVQVSNFVEPKTKWRNSAAKKMLFDDVNSGKVPIGAKEHNNNKKKMTLQEIYQMHSEYSTYDYKKFASRLSSVRNTIKKLNNRATEVLKLRRLN